MAHKSYGSQQPTRWVTLGGVTREGKKNPVTITGYYLGREEKPDKFNPGKTKINFILDTPEGITGVNGNSNLVKKMTENEANFRTEHNIPPLGAEVVMNYTGTKDTGKGNPMKVYTVTFDRENMKDLDIVVVTSDAYEDDDGADADEEDDTEVAYAPSPNLGKVAASSTLTPAERQAKVKELLKKKA